MCWLCPVCRLLLRANEGHHIFIVLLIFHASTSPSSCSPQALQRYRDGPQSSTGLEKAPGSTAHYLIWSVKEGQWETGIDTLDPGSRQIAMGEGRDGLAGLRDLVVVVVVVNFSHPILDWLKFKMYLCQSATCKAKVLSMFIERWRL